VRSLTKLKAALEPGSGPSLDGAIICNEIYLHSTNPD